MNMKKSMLFALALIAGISVSQAQNEKNTWGIKGGLNFPMNGFTFSETGDNISAIFTEEERATGWHAGIFGRLYAGDQLYFGSSLLYLQNDYVLSGIKNELPFNQTFITNGGQMDVVAGIEMLKFLRVQGGVNGIMYFNDSWNNTFDTFGAGYTFGAGVDLWKFTIDVSYNGSFKDNSGIWNGVPLSYNRSDLMVSLGFKF